MFERATVKHSTTCFQISSVVEAYNDGLLHELLRTLCYVMRIEHCACTTVARYNVSHMLNTASSCTTLVSNVALNPV